MTAEEKLRKDKRTVVMTIEPSKRLSELCGFSYFIERRFTVAELAGTGVIDNTDIERMELGEQIHKSIPIASG